MQPGDYSQVIYDRGCLRAGEEWVKRNLVPVAAVAVALAVLQVELAMCFSKCILFSNCLSHASLVCHIFISMLNFIFLFLIMLCSACMYFCFHRKVMLVLKLMKKAVYKLVTNG